jgi:hypothetical protein
VNALQDGPSLEAAVSFDVAWSGVAERVKIRNTETDFAGEYVRNSATLVWSATNESGFSFDSDPSDPLSNSEFATIGHERNGSFFS